MKKSLVALAALAVVGAASAQSSVTMYGTLDVGYGGGTANGVETKFQQQSSYNSTSKVGFKGTEDLGGGLKANFNFETGKLNNETGATALDTSRASYVGLQGNFGTVNFGRIASKAAAVMGGFDFNGTSTSSAYATVGLSAVTWYGSSRRSSQLQYTGNFGDVTVHFGNTLENDGPPGGNNRATLGANYAKGALAVGLVAESAATAADRNAYALGASYDFGAVKAAVTYNQATSDIVGQGYTLAAVAPFGAVKVGIQYAHNNGDKLAATAPKNATELFANYSLSKRTSLYIDSVFASDTVGGANKSYNMGIIHQF